MNKEQLLFLYQNYANDKGFESFDEFSSLMSNKESREVFFNESNKDLGFSDFNEFESTLGMEVDVKKKEESDSFAQEQAVESPTSSVPTITLSEEELQEEQPAGVFIDKSQDDKPTVSREFEVDASSLEGKKQKSSKNLSQLTAYNIPNLSDKEYSKLKNKTFQLPDIPKSKRDADALYDLPVDEYGNKYDFTKRFIPEEQPNGEVEFVDTRDEDLAQAIDNYEKSKRNLSTTVKEGRIVSRDYLNKELDFNPSIDDQEVIRVTNSDPKDYLSWKEENVRKEGGAYKFFKNLLTNEEGENFEKEQRQYLRASSYKASTLNKVQEDIETIDARISLTTNDEEILRLENEKERLKSSYKKEMKELGSLIEKFPKFKEKTRDLDKERRSKIYNNSLEGSSFGDVSMNALSSSSEAIVDMSVGFLSFIPSIVDQIATVSGFEEKGVFAGMTEMLLDTSEHYSIEYGAAKRSAFIQGKSVDYEDREYIVSDEGQIYDAETNILVTDLMGEEKVSDILDMSKDSNIDETNFDSGAFIENTASTLANLFGLIKGAGTLRSVSRNVLPKAINKKISKEAAGRISMGATSYATSSASTVQELKNDLMDKGLTEKEATEKAIFFGNAIASLDGVFSGLAGSNEKLLSSTSGIKKTLIDLAKKDGAKFTTSELKRKSNDLIKENLKEVGVEELPVLFSEKAINGVMNKSLGMTIRSGEVTSAEILETLFLTLGATTSLGTRGLLKNNTRSSMLDLLSQKDVNYEKYKNELVNQGSITNEEADSVIKEIKEYTEANSIINNTIKISSNKRKAARLIKKQRKLKERLKNTEPSLSEDLENQIEEIDNSINELKEKDKRDLSRIKKGDDLETTPEEDPFASEEDGGLKLKEQASQRLLDRKKESGEEEFTVTDEEITEEALKIQEENRRKAEIKKLEEEKQKELNLIGAKRLASEKTGEVPTDSQGNLINLKEEERKINDEYDSRIKALEETTQEQEISQETTQQDLEAREQEIESGRREELEPVELAIAISNETGETPTVNDEVVSVDNINEINAKYDAELKALEESTTPTQPTEAKKADIEKIESDKKADKNAQRLIKNALSEGLTRAMQFGKITVDERYDIEDGKIPFPEDKLGSVNDFLNIYLNEDIKFYKKDLVETASLLFNMKPVDALKIIDKGLENLSPPEKIVLLNKEYWNIRENGGKLFSEFVKQNKKTTKTQSVSEQQITEEKTSQDQSDATASTIAQETEGLTATQTFKQGLSEFVSSLREKESGKRKKLEQSYKEKLKNAKDKLKQKIKDSKDDIEAKNFLSTFIKDISSTAQKDKTIKLDEISSAALRKIQSKVKKADRSNLDQVIEEVFDIFDSQVRKKRNSNVQKKQIRARKKVKSGKAGMNQSSYLGSLRINPKFIPNTEKGNELLTRLENLLDSLTAKNIKIQDETGFNLQKEAVQLSNMYQEMLDESSNLFEKLKEYQEQNNNPTKKEAILSMFSQGVINMNEARVLEGFNPPKKVDTKKKEGVTEEEQQERNELIGSILANKPDQRETFNKTKFFRDIVDDINSFTQEDLESTSTENLRTLNNDLLYALPANELTNIGKVITSVKSSKIVRDVKSLLGSNPARASVLNLAAQIGGLANRSIKNWGERSKALSAPLENIDFEVFRNYNLRDKKVYKNLFEPLAKAFSSRTDFVNRAFFLMDSALEKIRKEGNNKDFNKSSVKLAVLGLNQEYLSNPDNNKVFNPVDVINETLKSLVGKDSGYLDSYKEALQSFLNDFATMQDGNVVSIDYDAINESLTEGESDYLNNWNSEISPDLEQMGAIVTSAVRGESWSPLISYMPRVTMAKQTAKGIENIAESALTGDGGLTSNAKASVNKERVASTAPPMILDIFKSHRRAITEQSTDYHMTLALKNIASAIEKLKTEFSNEKNETGAKNVDLLERVLKRAVENDLVKVSASNNDLEVGWLADAINYFRKKGYQFGLGYATRAAAELGSNFSFSSVAYPTETKNGLKYVRINEEDFINLAEMISLVKSAQSSRLLGQELTSLMVEQGAIGTDSVAAIGKYGGAISSLSKKTGQTIDSIQRALLGRPDLITSRVTWIGTFATEYKKITGKKFNLNNFSSKVYFDNKEAFDEATKIADEKLSESVSTNNPYAGIVGSTISPKGGSELFKIFDKYLTRFQRQEKSTFKKGAIIAIKGEKGSGKNRKEGFRLMGASMSRMIMYTQLQQLGIGGLIALAEMLLGYGDDDEEDFGIIQKSIRIAQGHEDSEKYLYDINNEALSALLMIGTGGYGNVSKLAFNFGLETTNMYYGEGLTRPKGENYDSFNNGLTYSFVNPEVLQGRSLLAKDLSFLASANGAVVKNLIEVVQNSNSALNSKSKKTRDKAKEKLLYRNLPTLIGTTTGIPTKDIVNVSNHYLYAPKERDNYTEGLDVMSKEFRKQIDEIMKNMRD